jgi:HlyD family secretion protein
MDPTDLSPVAQPAPRTDARPFRNGPASLGERVQSLRLRSGSGRGAAPRSAWLPWGFTLICVLLTMAWGYRAYRYSRPEAVLAAAADNPSPGNTSSSSAPVGEVALESKGYVIAAHTIQISPQVGGEIIYLDKNFREGVVFQKGTIIAIVDPISFEARVKSAKALVKVAEVNLSEVQMGGSALKEIEAARSQLSSLEAKLNISIIDERNKLGAGVGSTKDEKDKATAQVLADRAAHASQEATLAQLEKKLKERIGVAEAQLLKSKADLEDAEKQLKNCTIIAPTTGFILSKKAELGGYVNPLAFGAAGYLCEMADLGDLEIEIDVQERDLPRVFTDQVCLVMPEAYRRDDAFLKVHPRGYEGRVSRLMPTANRSKGAVPVRVAVVIPEGEAGKYLRPDMGVIVSFLNRK